MLTNDQILEMAKQMRSVDEYGYETFDVIAFTRLIEAKVREEDAQICASTVWVDDIRVYREMTKRDVAVRSMLECAAAIRNQS